MMNLSSLRKYAFSKKTLLLDKKRDYERKLRIGVIGCGIHATENIYPCLRYCPVELEAVCALHEFKAKRNAQWFGAKRTYTDYKEMLDKETLDAVFVVVNRKLHKEICQYALQKGIPVFVEKPPVSSLEEIKELVKTSKETGKLCFVAFQKRYAPIYQRAKEIMFASGFRTPTIQIRYAGRSSGSEEEFLWELGIHYIDLLRYFLGDVKYVFVEKQTKGDLAFLMVFRFQNNAVGSLLLSAQTGNQPCERVEIYGKNQSIIIDNLRELFWYKGNPGKEKFQQKQGAEVWVPNYTHVHAENQSLFLNGYAYEVQAFIDAIKENKKPENRIGGCFQNIEILEVFCKENKNSFSKEFA